MSLPSLLHTTQGVDLDQLSEKELDDMVFAAMKTDLPLACDYLHQLSHRGNEPVFEDPNSELGKQLIRICASDSMRPLAEARLTHGKQITFFNCCGIQLGEKKPSKRAVTLTQIRAQAGPLAYADC